jgi:hypothetical protein
METEELAGKGAQQHFQQIGAIVMCKKRCQPQCQPRQGYSRGFEVTITIHQPQYVPQPQQIFYHIERAELAAERLQESLNRLDRAIEQRNQQALPASQTTATQPQGAQPIPVSIPASTRRRDPRLALPSARSRQLPAASSQQFQPQAQPAWEPVINGEIV